MNGLPNASAVVIEVATGFTVRPNAASVAAGTADARETPAELGQVIAVPRTVQTNQLLVIRSPLVTLAAPFVADKGLQGMVTLSQLEGLALRFPGANA